VTVRN